MDNNKQSIVERYINEVKEADSFLKKTLVSGAFIGKISIIFGFSIALMTGIKNILANTTNDIEISVVMLAFICVGFIFEQSCRLCLLICGSRDNQQKKIFGGAGTDDLKIKAENPPTQNAQHKTSKTLKQ